MELDEIARSLEEIRLDMLREVNAFERRDAGPHRLKDGVRGACVRIYAVGRMLDDLAGATAPEAAIEGEGFVVLPVGRFDELRQAEEHLEETRFEPAEAAAYLQPGPTAREPALHPVLDKHLQDVQAEIDGIKERLDEDRRWLENHDRAVARLVDGVGEDGKAFGPRLDELFDRIEGLRARLARMEAREGHNPILREEARKQEEAIKTRLLQELNSARKMDPS
jgi:hypothetical protein